MTAGTISLTNGSTSVSGNGTGFTTDLAANDFIVCKIGGMTYTLGVSTIGSNTALTLTQPFTGPTTSGIAWYAVPNQTLVGITTELAANLTSVYRSVLVNDANWTKVFSQSGNITVVLKDGSTYTGPSWRSITDSLNGYLLKSDNLASVADKGQALENLGGFSKSGGAIAGNVTIEGTFAQSGGAMFYNGDLLVDSGELVAKKVTDAGSGYYNSSFVKALLAGRGANGDPRGAYAALLCQEQSGVKFSGYVALNGFGSNVLFEFRNNGNAYAPQQWVSSSDKRIKTNIKKIEDPLAKMRLIKGVTWDRLDRFAPGIGFIAQDVQDAFPSAVSIYGDMTMADGTVVKDVLAPDTSGVAAALHHESILALMDIITELQERMKAVDGLDA